MKLSELLSRGRPTVSCELFPPKVGTTLDQVEGVLRDTAALRPDFISVTYGAGGSTSKRTQEIAVRLQDTYHVPALAHLTCVSSTREEISSMVAALRAAGIENILALRGALTIVVVRYIKRTSLPRNTTTMPVSSSATSEAWRAERSCASARLAIPRGTWNVPTGRTISIS